MPYIDTFPSIYTSKILTSLIKLRSTYPSWDTNKIATHLHLPEVKEFKPKISLNRQQVEYFFYFVEKNFFRDGYLVSCKHSTKCSL